MEMNAYTVCAVDAAGALAAARQMHALERPAGARILTPDLGSVHDTGGVTNSVKRALQSACFRAPFRGALKYPGQGASGRSGRR